MKRIFLYFSLVLCACEAPKVESHQMLLVPDIEQDASLVIITKDGPTTLVDNLPFSGYLVSFHENGQLKSKTGYLKGLKEGEALQYYATGSLKEKRFYLNNRKDGRHQGWWLNGKPKFDHQFVAGYAQGESKEWYETGQAYRSFTYSNGQEDGAQKMWEVNGKIRANYVVKKGHRYGLIGLKNCKSVSGEKGVFTARAY